MTLQVEPRGPVTEDQVAAVERELGVTLPEPYRTWLRATNGGDLDGDVEIPGTDGNGLLSDLDGVDRLPTVQTLARNKVVPAGYTVVTLGHGGSLALRTGGAEVGSVWWADFDVADELNADGPTNDVMRRLAEDWDGFLGLW